MNYFMIPDFIATFSIEFISFYFAFEMKIVQDKLEAQTPFESIKLEKKTKLLRTVILTLFTVLFLMVLSGYVYRFVYKENTFDMTDYLVVVSARTIKFLAVDIFMLIFFLRLIIYFTQKKLQKLT